MRIGALFLLLVATALAGEKTLQRDDGKKAGHKSRAGSGHVIALEAPKGKWWVRSVSLHGARYGGGYDPATTEFTVTICDEKLQPLGSTTAAYSAFQPGRFEWVEVAVEEPVALPRRFKVVVEFSPTRSKGVYLGHSATKESQSGYGVPGGRERPFDQEWMIRVRASNQKPNASRKKKKTSRYVKDFEFVARTVQRSFPALEKKGVDWKAVCRDWRPRFLECKDDPTHLLNVTRMLAVLNDVHTGVIKSKVVYAPPAFVGLYGGGVWIAREKERLIVRALLPGHPLAAEMPRGSELLAIAGRPAGEVHAQVRARVREWYGMSSYHFLDARLSFQFFPFDRATRLQLKIRTPGGEERIVTIERWGPGGKGLSRVALTMPEGVVPKGHAVSAKLDGNVGYLRILGGMSELTRKAFDRAIDELKDVKGILLDCRGMGGGGDGPAWAMVGRFLKKRTPLGSSRPLQPTGAWQFDGPVVMLQDERMVSSAETFTWAMTETGRALSVGRPTGGATIIPEVFRVPSGLFEFRLGVHDRRTPIKKIQPEGVGTPPDVYVAYTPAALAADADPVLTKGLAALRMLLDKKTHEEVVAALR